MAVTHPDSQKKIEFKELLKKVSYKPGWGFSVQKKTGKLSVTANVDCTRTPTKEMIWISLPFEIPAEGTVDTYMKFIRKCILVIEEHELDEFLQYENEIYNDPH